MSCTGQPYQEEDTTSRSIVDRLETIPVESTKTMKISKWNPGRCAMCQMELSPLSELVPNLEMDHEWYWRVKLLYTFSTDLGLRGLNLSAIRAPGCALSLGPHVPGYFAPGLPDHLPAETNANYARIIDPCLINYGKVGRWIRECQFDHKNHDLCSHQGTHSADVLSSLLVIDCSLGLIIDLPKGQDYLALSYVWGAPVENNPPDKHATKFRSESCPRTIQDSIAVTKALGYRYLWIDGYCIDQSDAAKTSYQLAMMDRIYENATVTLVAAAGIDDRHGLPGAGTRPFVPRKQVSLKIDQYRLVYTGIPIQSILQRTKWAERGWTYQEMYLSKRCLFFTERQAILACRSSVFYEDLPYFEGSRALLKPNLELSLYDLQRHLSQYVMRSLTYESDVLNAFKGILSRCSFHSYWGIPIIKPQRASVSSTSLKAGFLFGLAWIVIKPVRSARCNSLPSWTWASLNFRTETDLYPRYLVSPLDIQPITVGSYDIDCIDVWLENTNWRGCWDELDEIPVLEHRKVVEERTNLLKIASHYWNVSSVAYNYDNSTGELTHLLKVTNVTFTAYLDTKDGLEFVPEELPKLVEHLGWKILVLYRHRYRYPNSWNTSILVIRPRGENWERIGCSRTFEETNLSEAKRGTFVLC